MAQVKVPDLGVDGLKASDDQDAWTCVICSDETCGIAEDNRKCRTEGCNHECCHFLCQKKYWEIQLKEQTKATCVMCRCPYDRVLVDGQWYGVSPSPLDADSPQSDSEESEEEFCLICGNSDGVMLICDSCDDVCHIECAGLDRVPEGLWFCSNCEHEQRSQILEVGRSRQHRSRAARRGDRRRQEAAVSRSSPPSSSSRARSDDDLLSEYNREEQQAKDDWVQRLACSHPGLLSSRLTADQLVKLMEAAMKGAADRRIRTIRELRDVLRHNLQETFVRLAIDKGLLAMIRSWFQLSFDSPNCSSDEERRFRLILVMQLQLIAPFVRIQDVQASRINKALQRSVSDDSGTTKSIAEKLMLKFTGLISSSAGSSSSRTETGFVESASNNRKRPKLRRVDQRG